MRSRIGSEHPGTRMILGQGGADLGRWLAGLLLALTATLSLAQGAPWVVRAVHGYRSALAVESVFESAEPGTDPRHARTLEHRLRVTVHEESSGRAAPLASISADVAESGYSGTTIALAPARSRSRSLNLDQGMRRRIGQHCQAQIRTGALDRCSTQSPEERRGQSRSRSLSRLCCRRLGTPPGRCRAARPISHPPRVTSIVPVVLWSPRARRPRPLGRKKRHRLSPRLRPMALDMMEPVSQPISRCDQALRRAQHRFLRFRCTS